MCERRKGAHLQVSFHVPWGVAVVFPSGCAPFTPRYEDPARGVLGCSHGRHVCVDITMPVGYRLSDLSGQLMRAVWSIDALLDAREWVASPLVVRNYTGDSSADRAVERLLSLVAASPRLTTKLIVLAHASGPRAGYIPHELDCGYSGIAGEINMVYLQDWDTARKRG